MLPAQPTRPTKIRGIIFTLSVGTSWLLYLHRYTYGLIRPKLQEDYHFTDVELGYIESAFYFPYALGQVPCGAVCDTFGAHWFLGGSILVWSLMLLTMALTSNVWLFAGARGLFGAAQSGTYPSLAKVTREWFPPQSRTFVQGCVASFGGRSGAALCPIIFYMLLILVLGLSWQQALLVFSVGGLIFGAAFLLFFRSSPQTDPRVNATELALITAGEQATAQAAAPGKQSTIPVMKLLSHGTLWIFAAQQFMNAGADIIFVGHLPSYFKAELGISMDQSPAMLAMFVSLPFFAGALGGLFAGYLNDWLIARTGNRRWSRSGIAFAGNLCACGLVLVAMWQVNPWGAAIAFAATKFFTDWTQPTCWGACTDIGGRYSATVVGVINMAGNLGATAMPLVIGRVLQAYKTTDVVNGVAADVTNYKPVLMLGGALFLLSAASWFFIDCTKALEPPAERK